jgi:DNA polymerase-3 subunit delta
VNIKPDRLAQALEKTLAPVYLVAGSEPLLVQESRDLIIQAARKHGYLGRDIHVAGKFFEWELLENAGVEQSLFSSRKIVDLRLASGKPGLPGGKALSKWAKAPDPDVLLVVSCDTWDTASRNSRWASDLAEAGVMVDIWPIKPQELPAWIERRMRALGFQPGKEAVQLLADLVEGNLLAAQQEIEKLVMLGHGSSITADTIRLSVANSSRFDAFRLSECLLAGDAAEGLKVAAGLRRTGVAIQAVTGALYYQLSQLSAVQSAVLSGENEERVFSRLRIFRLAQPLYRQALRRVSAWQLGDSLRALSLVDRQGKGRAAGDPWQTLDGIILGLCAGSA